MSTTVPKLTTQEARYGVALDYIYFPLDLRDLRQALAKNGYELASSMKDLPPSPTRISFGGEIARIKEIRIFADSDAGQIGVVGRTLEEACTSFEDFAKIVDSELGADLHKKVKFYFISVHYRIITGKMPLKEIPKAENKEFINKVNEVMKDDLSSFSIRLSLKNASLNQKDWFDIAIEPDIIDESRYHIGVVFRNSEKKKTEAFVKDLENNLLKLIAIVEA